MEHDEGGILFSIELEGESVTYRRDAGTRKSLFGVDESADRVLAFHRRRLPKATLECVWQDGWDLLDVLG